MAAAAASVLTTAIAIAVVGTMLVGAVAGVFYVVGRSEDRERAEREAAGRVAPTPGPARRPRRGRRRRDHGPD
jgi:flagellar basal body-associated protein FliL